MRPATLPKSTGFVSRFYIDIIQKFLGKCKETNQKDFGLFGEFTHLKYALATKEIHLFCSPKTETAFKAFLVSCFRSYKVKIEVVEVSTFVKHYCIVVLGTKSPLSLRIVLHTNKPQRKFITLTNDGLVWKTPTPAPVRITNESLWSRAYQQTQKFPIHDYETTEKKTMELDRTAVLTWDRITMFSI